MIHSDFLVINESGLYCKYGEFYLDPKQPVGHAVISHAHGDHAVRGNQHVHCTAATAAIIQHRYRKNAGKIISTYGYHESFDLNGIKITLYPAGHILGSAQVLMEFGGVRYVYTGDYKLQEDPTCEKIELIRADVLITETTFADPEVRHPDPIDEVLKLNEFDHNVLLGTYSLGKAQRLIYLITTHCPEKKILVHHSMLPLNKIYESFGFNPGAYEPYNRKLMKEAQQNYIYLVPPLTFNSYFRAKNVIRAFASGWKKLQLGNDLQLLISDHVDWQDILYVLEQVKPDEVWTLHGNGKHLENYFEGKLKIKLLNSC